MSGRLSMKIATSVALVIVLLGSVVGLAVVRGDLRFGPKRSALVLKRSKTLTVPITGLAPGDRVERLMTLENRGRTPLRRLRFEIGETARAGIRVKRERIKGRRKTVCRSAKTSRRVSCKRTARHSALVLTRGQGLRVSVERCPVPWAHLRARAPTYRCPKKKISVVGWSSIPVRRVLRETRPLRPGARAYLRITLQFPQRATNALQGKTSVLVPRFTAIGGLR